MASADVLVELFPSNFSSPSFTAYSSVYMMQSSLLLYDAKNWHKDYVFESGVEKNLSSKGVVEKERILDNC